MIVLATADWVIPVITGFIGLAGVFVGAVVGGLIERWQIKARDSRNLCIAARLIYDELTTNRATVQTMQTTEEGLRLKTDLWAAVRADIAVPEVDIEHFKVLTVGYVVLEIFNEALDEGDGDEQALALLDDDFAHDLEGAIEIAAQYAGDN